MAYTILVKVEVDMKLEGKKVLVVGTGISGIAATELLIKKEDSKELKNNVDNSSSGGGSSSGEYYLFDKDLIGTYFPEIGNDYSIIYMFCASVKIIT